MKRISMIVATLAVVGALAGCSSSTSGPAQTIEIKAESMAFGSKEITVEKGKTYKLVFTNNDSLMHDLSVDTIPVKAQAAAHGDMHDMGGKHPDLHVAADAGKSGTVEFTPTKEGSYTFYCTVAGHKDAGMVGTLIVK